MTDDQVAKLARVMVVVLGLISLVLAIYRSATLVGLLLTGYAGVAQFFPGVVLGLYWERVTMPGVFAGMIAGIATVIFLMLSHRDPLYGWNAGFVALCLNFLITAIVSWLTPEIVVPDNERLGSNPFQKGVFARMQNLSTGQKSAWRTSLEIR